MPYTIAETGSGDKRWCVFRKGPDGGHFGDTLGCHESREKAQAQIVAIWASEGARKAALADESDQAISEAWQESLRWYAQRLKAGGAVQTVVKAAAVVAAEMLGRGLEWDSGSELAIAIGKGGPGSGNWGHAGRPGEVGGSASLGTVGRIVGPASDLRFEAEDKVSGNVVIEFSEDVDSSAFDDDQIAAYIKAHVADVTGKLVSEDVEEIIVSNVERGAGYITADVEITPTEEAGASQASLAAGRTREEAHTRGVSEQQRQEIGMSADGTATTVAKAATIKNRARRLLRDLTELLADKTLPERVRRAMEDVPGALRATWADLEDEAGAEDEAKSGTEAVVIGEVAKAKANPVITFVAASPGHLEAARQEPLVGPSGKVFKTSYLEPLGLTRENTRLLFLVDRLLLDGKGKVREPTDEESLICKQSLYNELDSGPPTVVVALGQVARRALAGRATFVLPHPTAVRLLGDSGEVARKLKQIRKALDAAQVPDGSGQTGGRERMEHMARILKADDERQEIYGVVLEPDTVDEQDDTITTDEIAKTAHNFLVKSRVVGDSHRGLAPVEVIESYTAPGDTAINGQVVKAGSWVIGVHVSDGKLWKSVKAGDYSGFSVGGWANRGSA